MNLVTPCVRFLFVLAALWAGPGDASFFVDPTGGTVLWDGRTGADDEVKVGRVLGFPLSYFGSDPILKVDVSTNGNVNFSANSDYANESLTTTIARISPLWDDLEVMAGTADSITEKRVVGKYYAVTWQVHERDRPATHHAFQVVIMGAAGRVNGFDFLKDDIVFCYDEIGATFSKGKATVSVDQGDGGTIVPVPGVTALNGLLPYDEAGFLPEGKGGFLLFRSDDAGSYTVTVFGNRAPRPRDDTCYIKNRAPFSIDVLANDSDPDLDPLEIVSVTPANFGDVRLSPNGTLLYTPGKLFRGRDGFSYTVRDPSGLTGTANVKVRPFSMGNGTFEGFLRNAPTDDDPAPELTPEGGGYFKISLRGDGGFTGVVIYGGLRKTLAGKFDERGDFTMQYTRLVDGEPQTITLTLHLDLLDQTQPLTGSITDGDSTSNITAARALAHSLASPAPQAGPYKILLLPDESSGPLGIGYGSLRVTPKGLVSLVGKLGDGRNLSFGGSIKPDGTFPLYVNIPGPPGARAGALWGAVTFDDTDPTSDCSGALRWSVPDTDAVSGFDAVPSLVGNRLQPIVGSRMLTLADGFGNATIDLGDGQYSEMLTIDAANKVTVVDGGEERLAITIAPMNASFRGSFVEAAPDPPYALKMRRLNGVFLKKLNMGGGQYRDADGNSAAVLIQPPAPDE